jgi:hypothetical protein
MEFVTEFANLSKDTVEKELLISTILALIAVIVFNGAYSFFIVVFSIVYAVVMCISILWSLLTAIFTKGVGASISKTALGGYDESQWDKYVVSYPKRFTTRSFIY